MPVSVTFCLYIYLFIYYAAFYLHPTISMDYSKVSFDAAWTDSQEEMKENRNMAIIYACIFGFTATSLIVAIIRTIATNPGNIPEHKEWDMSTDTSAGEETSSMINAAD